MAINKKEVEHVALLARLSLSENEKEKFVKQLGQILGHAGKISKLDTREIKPTFHALPVKNVFREDKEKPSLTQAEALSNAPVKEDGMIKIPKIV
ncbi:Asp-tRNA(Asn)/Glu-tRNA(Gln) amidotransferase subunit GatC [Candidatus Oleimmundimicrobium sp.]|uniref:Asp-tRNA(Asn)/Glu-tRNA(Gln) amidotransferase subunit GatC n=1 Tax=Candidatus Oleimmundimicrobium sp. TaxID=3060597 RepID=UPI002722E04C|nr:Asp-tRNA(Asn)/Glu-tRNA(Gln) amidotransferase subunit GatC [Candidatus Oleimmundimicrobium sp.]MDO8886587.1 Asp-tRNA(Asn)/Glu-tRNA(Gln) amidotransferase subunit GatC [Candidatus Oleimmundimicrobium sp.]